MSRCMEKDSGIKSPTRQVITQFICSVFFFPLSADLPFSREVNGSFTGLKRCGKSCRLRWMNYLSPNVKKNGFSEEEEALIIRLHKLLGNRFWNSFYL